MLISLLEQPAHNINPSHAEQLKVFHSAHAIFYIHPTHPQQQGCSMKQSEQHPPGIEVKFLDHAMTASSFQMARAQSPI